ncbi:Hint domain-containing protein [Acidisphaera sp. S103]|uniref:Hint domain-containing protein n=1 Tax=Acidisphaera sp. S103 TaxID=1747223 RepID=UPI00131B3111|nr:Hint domain-containing protein [Acidisphaera sp. S103]
MTNPITGTYATLVSLTVGADNPTTIASNGLLTDGLSVSYTGLAVVNAGSIDAGSNRYGIQFLTAGSVTNQSGGSISSGGFGVYGNGGGVTVVNAGSIAGYFGGVRLGAGGYVTNQSGGAISSERYGVFDERGAVTVVNAGSIAGSKEGVFLLSGGSVTNQSGGSITSGFIGINAYGGVTVVNAGTIGGARYAVLFGAGYANRLVIDPNAVFYGTVTGGNTIGATSVSTLELASAGSAGTLSGFGTKYVDFAQVTVDAGAQWTLAGANTIAAGSHLTDAGTLTNAGTLNGGGALTGVLTLVPGGVLSNASTGTITAGAGSAVHGAAGGAATVVNAGMIAGDGAEGQGVYLAGGGSVTNLSGAVISGDRYGIYGRGATVAVVNAGSIAGSGPNGYGTGIDLAAGGSVTNQSGGSISGYRGISGQGGAVTVVNAGSIAGTNEGVVLSAGGNVTNQSGGSITSGFVGISGAGAAVTVVNAGSVAGSRQGVVLFAGGNVTNQSGGSITGQDGIFGAGAPVTVVNAGSIAGSNIGVFLEVGGSVTNQSDGTISGGYGIDGYNAAVTVVNAGSIAGGSYAVKFAAGYASRLIADPGAVFAGNVQGGGGVLELASAASAGTLSGFGTSIANFSALQFDTGAAWTVSGTDSASGLGTIGITGFANGDTIDLTGFLASGETFANNTLVLTGGVGGPDTLNIQGAFTSDSFQLSPDGNGGTDIVVCFRAGTMIGTPAGEVPVETLNIGDLVLTAQNGPRAVTWIGNGKVLATRGRRSAATPVIVRKGALADNVPNADLHVTKAHSLYIDGVLIPVEFLVNHRTILWDDRAREVDIYHVELDSHDVLLANGALAESYRDDGNRWLFHNANTGWHLPPQDPYAPVLTGGPVVDAAWRRLDRTGPRALPSLTEEPDLHLVIDGVRVDPEYRRGSLYGFRLPSCTKSVVIASRVGVPSELGLARDPRSLGVALRQVAIRQGGKFMLIEADDDRLTVGFHAYEAGCHLRWTNGSATLPIAAFARFDKGAEVMLHLGGATQYLDDGASAARVA